MSTKIYMYDGRLVASIPDYTLDTTSTSIKIPGNYYDNYGQAVMESILWSMQNFAGDTEPPSPILGQTWYDSVNKVMRVYNGNVWAISSSVFVSNDDPGEYVKGQLWYDGVNKQLKIWNGSAWDIVGPLGSAVNNDPVSNSLIPDHSAFQSIKLSDGVNKHQVWRWTIGGKVVAILSLDPVFSPSPVVTGFASIYPGLNFNSTISGAGVNGDPTLMKTNRTNLPISDNTYDLGSTSLSFKNVYAVNGLYRTSLGVGGTAGAYTFKVTGTSQFTSQGTFSTSLGVGGDPGAYTFKVIGTSQFTSTANFVANTQFSSTVSFGSTASFGAGTATAAPALFATGSLLSAAAIGALEFNGGGFFATVSVGGTPTRKSILTSGNVVIANASDSAAQPGLTWQGSTDTGFFNPSSGVVAVTTNGTEKLRVNGNGAIGIGGSNFGTPGSSLVTNGSGAAPTWEMLLPPGVMMPYAGAGAPSGWLLCYGQSLSTATYADLFAAIGYTYGGSGGSFNLPDLRGRVVAGRDNMGGTSANRLTAAGSGVNGDVLGTSGGEETHQLTVAELALHGHPAWLSFNTDSTPHQANGGGFMSTTNSDSLFPSYTGVPNATKGEEIGGEGGNQPHNNVQPTFILNYIIKT